MADIFQIGVSGLIAFQNAINTTSHNINNAYTEGYSRRTISFSERSNALYGSGVESGLPIREYSLSATSNLRNSSSAFYAADSVMNMGQRLESFFNNDVLSISTGLNDMFASLQAVNNNPTSIESRMQFLSNTEALVNRFDSISTELHQQYQDANSELRLTAERINQLAQNFADINQRLVNPASGESPSLLDKRDEILQSLSEYVSYTTVAQDDGMVNIYIGSGNPLVLGQKASVLSTSFESSSLKYDVSISATGTPVVITDELSGGKLSGIIQFQNDMLDQASILLGRTALGVMDAFNQQSQLGMNLDNEIGGNLFNELNAASAMQNRVFTYGNNTGSANLAVQIDDVNAITDYNYEVLFTTASDYTITRADSGALVTTGTLGGIPGQISLDGFTLDVSGGTIAAGDRFRLTPTQDAARDLQIQLTDPRKVAVASPIITEQGLQNTGSASISLGEVVDTTTSAFSIAGQLNPPVRVEFLAGNSYQLVNANTAAVIEGPIAYDPNIENQIFPTPGTFDPGYRVSIAGSANAGDQFTIGYNSDGTSDNRNGFALAERFSQKSLGNGTLSIAEGYNGLLSRVALDVNAAQSAQESASIVFESAAAARDAISRGQFRGRSGKFTAL